MRLENYGFLGRGLLVERGHKYDNVVRGLIIHNFLFLSGKVYIALTLRCLPTLLVHLLLWISNPRRSRARVSRLVQVGIRLGRFLMICRRISRSRRWRCPRWEGVCRIALLICICADRVLALAGTMNIHWRIGHSMPLARRRPLIKVAWALLRPRTHLIYRQSWPAC